MNKVTPYQAMMMAADQIERHPDTYCFMADSTGDGSKPACMWGWTGRFLGLPDFTDNCNVALACGEPDGQTSELYKLIGLEMHSAPVAALALRDFATERFPQDAIDPAYARFREQFAEVVCERG